MDSDRMLDGTTSSMDVPALNNLVVSFRPLVQRVKVQVIRKLTKNIKQLKSRYGTEEQKAAFSKKADRLGDEIESLKVLMKRDSVDRVAKQCLANTLTLDEAMKFNNSETRILTRIATHKLMSDKVKSWRVKHDDWKSLAAFMLSKNTGKRYKKKKAAAGVDSTDPEGKIKPKEKAMKQIVGDAILSENSAVLASESSAKSQVVDTGEREDSSESGSADSNSEEEVEEEKEDQDAKEADSEESGEEQETTSGGDDLMARLISGLKNGPSQRLSAMKDGDQDNESEDEDTSAIKQKKKSIKADSDSGIDLKKSKKDKKKSKSKDDKKQTEISAKDDDKIDRIVGDMVVTQFNLKDLSKDMDSLPISKPTAAVPDVSSDVEEEEVVVKKKKKRDPFFVRESGDEESSEEEEEDDGNVSDVDSPEQESRPGIFDGRNYKSGKFDKRDGPSMKGRPNARPADKKAQGPGKNFGAKKHGKASASDVPENLHPSWEASRKRKEQMSKIAPFAGKKIKFDD